MKKFIISTLCCLLSLMLITLVACTDTSKFANPPLHINYKIISELTIYQSGNYKNFITLCKSYDELISICNENGCSFFYDDNQENSLYNSTEYTHIRQLENFNYNKNALIVCGFNQISYSGQCYIKNIDIQNDTLTLFVASPSSTIAYDVVNYVFLIVSIPSSTITNITKTTYTVL